MADAERESDGGSESCGHPAPRHSPGDGPSVQRAVFRPGADGSAIPPRRSEQIAARREGSATRLSVFGLCGAEIKVRDRDGQVLCRKTFGPRCAGCAITRADNRNAPKQTEGRPFVVGTVYAIPAARLAPRRTPD